MTLDPGNLHWNGQFFPNLWRSDGTVLTGQEQADNCARNNGAYLPERHEGVLIGERMFSSAEETQAYVEELNQ